MADPLGAFAEGQDALLAMLSELPHECLALLDEDGRIVSVNREGARMLELSARDDLIGGTWSERWPRDTRMLVEAAFDSARAGTAARFSAMRPDSRREERWWDVTVTPIGTGGNARSLVIARDITAEHVERQRMAIVTAEMRHRLKNSMAIAAGIVTIAARSYPECQPFARDVGERLTMISTVQELLLDSAHDKSLAEIVPLLTGAYGGSKAIRFGAIPDVQLSDGAMQALALAFGELATNSLKYGALKSGRSIEITSAIDGTLLQFTWHEPTVFGAPRAGAQGLHLIDRLIKAVGGKVVREAGDGQLSLCVALPYRMHATA